MKLCIVLLVTMVAYTMAGDAKEDNVEELMTELKSLLEERVLAEKRESCKNYDLADLCASNNKYGQAGYTCSCVLNERSYTATCQCLSDKRSALMELLRALESEDK